MERFVFAAQFGSFIAALYTQAFCEHFSPIPDLLLNETTKSYHDYKEPITEPLLRTFVKGAARRYKVARNVGIRSTTLGTDVKIGDMDEQLRPVHEAIEQVGHYGLPVEQEYVLPQVYKLWFGEGYRPDKDRLD